MHLAVSVECKHGLLTRPCVTIGGGREPQTWESYENQRYLSTTGCIDCCNNGGCWKSRASKVFDGDKKDEEDLCIYPVEINYQFKGKKMKIPKCMKMIKPQDVIREIEKYYEGGILNYGSSLNNNIRVKTKRKKK